MGRKRDESIVGETYGALRVTGYSHSVTKPNHVGTRTYWQCQCLLCGQMTAVDRTNLINGSSTSCGCQFGLRQQVAHLAGVTPATVTEVLTGNLKKIVTQPTVAKVMGYSRQLGIKGRYYRDRLEEIEVG